MIVAIALAALAEAPSAWSAWLDEAHTLLGDPLPTGSLPYAEVAVITDQQVKFLGGERTALQSLTSDAAVDVAIRPIALDLFGFAPRRVLQIGLAQYRERY